MVTRFEPTTIATALLAMLGAILHGPTTCAGSAEALTCMGERRSGRALRDQANVRRLVDAENRDRRSLYRAIAEANDLDESRVPDIQKIFADTWIEKAEPGWPVQKADGSWSKR